MVVIQSKEYPTCKGLMMGLRAMLRKKGYKISKWYKGRIVWNATTGLELKTDVEFEDGTWRNVVRVEYNKNSKYEKDVDMNEVLEYLQSLGLKAWKSTCSFGKEYIYVYHSERERF
jgi:hypothetical protein